MSLKQDEGQLEKEIKQNYNHVQELNDIKEANCKQLIEKSKTLKKKILEFLEKRLNYGKEIIKIFPLSYLFYIIIGVFYTVLEEFNWYVICLVTISFAGILVHYAKNMLFIKLVLRLVFTSLLLVSLVQKLKSDYFKENANPSNLSFNQELSFYMKIFLLGHIFIILNDQFGLWEIDIIVALMQIAGIIYLFDRNYQSFYFWCLLLFPLYLFGKKIQFNLWIQKYYSLNKESNHLQQIFHDLWPHSLFVTSLDSQNQIQLEFHNRKAKEESASEKSIYDYFEKIKFYQFKDDVSDMSLGTYSKKDNLLKLLITKLRKFDEQEASNTNLQIVNQIQSQKSNHTAAILNPSANYLDQNKGVLTSKNTHNRSTKLIPQVSSVTPKKRHHSSLSKNITFENVNNIYKEGEFDPNKRKSTNLWSDNAFQLKNTQTDYEDGFPYKKVDKYFGKYFSSLDDPSKHKSLSIKIYYYSKNQDKQKYQFRSLSAINSYLINEQRQKYLFIEIKSLDQEEKNKKVDQINAKFNENSKQSDKSGLLKISKNLLKDINQHFQQIVNPYKQLVELMTSQQYCYNSNFMNMQIQQLQTLYASNYEYQAKQIQQQIDVIENNSFPYHLEYIQCQINTLIDHVRIHLNKKTKLRVEEINMQILFLDFFKNIQDSKYKSMDYSLEMDSTTFPQKYKQDPGRIKQILHYLFKKLVTNHDCINPKFVMKVSYYNKRTESFQNPPTLAFMESRTSHAHSEQYRNSEVQHRKSTLKQINNLYSTSNCFAIELILKGHCNFENIISKQNLKDKDRLYKTIQKIGQWLGSTPIEFQTQKDCLQRKYLFYLKEVNPKLQTNIEDKQDPLQKQRENLNNQNDEEATFQKKMKDDSKIYKTPINNNNNLEKIMSQINSNHSLNANFLKNDTIANTPVNQQLNHLLFSQTNVFQILDNNFQDQSQQSIQEMMHELNREQQIIVNQPIEFQSKFFK
ncbi:hypothetical protein ABPG74_012213 [Tetrahymena malaccensis]